MKTSPHFLAVPRSGTGPGVLVLHSWWGLNAFFRRLCVRFADAGFVALAPDLYAGRVAATVSAARKLRAEVTASRKVPAYRLLIAAVAELSGHEATRGPHIAVAGCSMGGHWALWLAQRPELPIASTVVFYAARGGDFRRTQSRFQVHLADQDTWVSPASVARMQKGLVATGTEVEYHVYPGTTHWFFESDRPEAYHRAAAASAWKRTLAFLRSR